MEKTIPLTKLQKELLKEFYSLPSIKVVCNKSERNGIWEKATKREKLLNFDEIELKCPALFNQIKKSYENGNNIQSAVFSECVYAQTLANMLKLNTFVIYSNDESFIPEKIKFLLDSYNLVPRYVYSNIDKSRMLIQAGGKGGIDSALITVLDLNIYTIEFKEPGAKSSEPDLPKYKEDGRIVITSDFVERYPQFLEMLKEQTSLNFFEVMGRNINTFSYESINKAITNNYVKNFADVICTEDIDGYFVMIPSNQVSKWAVIEGEIRPAGRNHYLAWTVNALKSFLIKLGAEINKENVSVKKSMLDVRKERGGANKISGYKITPLFFVYVSDCIERGDIISFDINKVRQLNPTITAKMFFKNLKYNSVKDYYRELIYER